MKKCTFLGICLLNMLHVFSQSYNANSFLPKTDFVTGNYPHSVAVADFNGDGKPDIFIAKGSSGVVTVLTNTGSGGNISFSPQTDFPATGTDAEGLAVADIDGDGKPDVVVTNGIGDSSVSVFRNTSTGGIISFAAKMDFRVNNGPYSIAIGDLDGDGKPDLAIANNGSTSISLFRNTSTPGNISFDTRTDISSFLSPFGIAIGDLDKDGKAELVVTTQGVSAKLYVLKNTSVPGTISFNIPVFYATLSGAFTVSVADLDGDGNPDIAALSGYPNAVLVLRNTSVPGNISFAASQNFAVGNYPDYLFVTDLDADGHADLVTANRFSDDISVLKNISTSGSIGFETHVDFPVGADPIYAAAGDLDGDGRPDLISANSSSNAISVLKNMIGLSVAPVISSFTPASGIKGSIIKISGSNFTGTTSVQFGGTDAASFSVDSATGITAVVGMGTSGDITVKSGVGFGVKSGFTFNGPLITSFAPTIGVAGDVITINGSNFKGVKGVSFGGTPAASFVLTGDTLMHATLGNGASGLVSVSTDSGVATSPGFGYGAAPVITSFSPASGSIGTTVNINGFNFDSSSTKNIVFFGAVRASVTAATNTQLKVIVPPGASYQPISVTTNNLSGYAALPFVVTFPNDSVPISVNSFEEAGNFTTGGYPGAVSISDLDNDGKPDLITANRNENSISILQNNSGSASISFKAKIDLGTGPDPIRIAVGDLDGDGKPDIVSSNFNTGNSGSISIFQNTSANGTISFAPKSDITTGNGPVGIAIADVNGDGKPDLIVACGNSGLFTIYKNITVLAGPIIFSPGQNFVTLTHPDDLTTADLDNNGKPDIIISNFSEGSISIYRNTSSGGNIMLAGEKHYAVGTNPGYLSTVDLDGDGRTDLAVENYGSGSVTFYKNFSFTDSIMLATRMDSVLAATNFSFADLDGDGKVDVCTGKSGSGQVSILQNSFSGSGNFSFSPVLNFTTGNYDVFSAVGDLDGDGRPEIVAVNTMLNTATILKNKIGGPVINSISDTSGIAGKTITISGRRFTGATAVTFGGVQAASFQVISPTQILARVGGGISGDIEVVTPGGNCSISGFHFIPQILTNGSTTICKNDIARLTSTALSNNQWYKDGVLMNGETDNVLRVSSGGLYSVKTTANGITTSSDTGVAVTVISVPAPVISKNGDNILVSGDSTGNQWYFNGTLIAGATNPTYSPTQNGLYTVTSNSNGCVSDYSNAYNFTLSRLTDLGNGQYVKIYPNPVTDNLNLKWLINNIGGSSLSISDFQGKQLSEYNNLQPDGMTINLSALPQGFYFLKIYNSQSQVNATIKIYKVN